MIDNTLKRYVLFYIPFYTDKSYILMDTYLKVSSGSSSNPVKTLNNPKVRYGHLYYDSDIPRVFLGEYPIVAESDYPITIKTHPELFI